MGLEQYRQVTLNYRCLSTLVTLEIAEAFILATSRLSYKDIYSYKVASFLRHHTKEFFESHREVQDVGKQFWFLLPTEHPGSMTILIFYMHLLQSKTLDGSYRHILSTVALERQRNLRCHSSDKKEITWLHLKTLMISPWMPKRRRA